MKPAPGTPLPLSTVGSIESARTVFARMYAGAPAYRSVVDAAMQRAGKNHVDELQWSDIPLITKDSFYSQYEWRDFLPRESYSDIYSILRSSGTASGDGTGRGFFWPRLRSEDKRMEPFLHSTLVEAFQLDKNKTLAIIALSLGSWAGGEQFSFTFKTLALTSQLPLVVFSPGNQHAEVIEIIERCHEEFDQIVIALCPSAIFYLERLAQQKGMALPLHKISFFATGEPFPEDLRIDLQRRAGPAAKDPVLLSLYGAADTGVIGIESRPLIKIRQFLHTRPEIARHLGFTSSIPNLFHLNVGESFYEVVDDELIVTKWQGIPLVRYNIKDKVKIFSWKTLVEAIGQFDPNPLWPNLAAQPWPDVVGISGRSQGCVFLCGSNIFETMLHEVFLRSSLSKISTGAFVVWTEIQNGQQILCWQVELAPDVAEPEITKSLHDEIVRLLCAQQPEFAEDYERFYRPFENQGFHIFRFHFTREFPDRLRSRIKRKIIVDGGPFV